MKLGSASRLGNSGVELGKGSGRGCVAAAGGAVSAPEGLREAARRDSRMRQSASGPSAAPPLIACAHDRQRWAMQRSSPPPQDSARCQERAPGSIDGKEGTVRLWSGALLAAEGRACLTNEVCAARGEARRAGRPAQSGRSKAKGRALFRALALHRLQCEPVPSKLNYLRAATFLAMGFLAAIFFAATFLTGFFTAACASATAWAAARRAIGTR